MKITDIVIPERARKEYGDLQGLSDSLKEVGMLHPIVVNGGNTLIAGARRLKAAEMLGWKEVDTRSVKSLDEALLALKAERDENACRKNLAPSEAVAMAERLEEIEKPKAKERQGRPGKPRKSSSAKLAEHRPQTREKVADAVGVSHATYQKAKAVCDAAKEKPSEFSDLVDRMDKEGKVDPAFREMNRRKRHKNVQNLPSGKFVILYADPPWDYGNAPEDMSGGAAEHYPCMTIKELCDFKDPKGRSVKDLSNDDAVLFLWVTSPMLFKSQKVFEAWGFEYRTCFVWDKVKHNMGHYNSARHEFLLICTRGSCTPQVRKLFDSVQTIEREEHSKKPKEFRDIIDVLYPKGKAVELFSRNKQPSTIRKWEYFGNE